MLKAIRFRASWVDPGSYGLVKAKEVEFKLGLGPCGLVVTALWAKVDGEILTITQHAYDPKLKWWQDRREIKEFSYKMSDVHGRIVTTS